MQYPDFDPTDVQWRIRSYQDVWDELLARNPSGRALVVGIDGHSGSGKTTLARGLAALDRNTAVVHTDDLAWHHSFFGWAELLIDHLLTPAREGRLPISYRPPAWVRRRPNRGDHYSRRYVGGFGRGRRCGAPRGSAMVGRGGVGTCPPRGRPSACHRQGSRYRRVRRRLDERGERVPGRTPTVGRRRRGGGRRVGTTRPDRPLWERGYRLGAGLGDEAAVVAGLRNVPCVDAHGPDEDDVSAHPRRRWRTLGKLSHTPYLDSAGPCGIGTLKRGGLVVDYQGHPGVAPDVAVFLGI